MEVNANKLHVYISIGFIVTIVCPVTRSPAGRAKNRGSIPGTKRDFPLLQNFQTDSLADPASYLMCTADFFTRG
jgi:hypothetical protein